MFGRFKPTDEVYIQHYREPHCLKLWCEVTEEEYQMILLHFIETHRLNLMGHWYSPKFLGHIHKWGLERAREIAESLVTKEILVRADVKDTDPRHRDRFEPEADVYYAISDRIRETLERQGFFKRLKRVSP